MQRQETQHDPRRIFEWLDKCPTHKWEITHEEYGHVVVSFPTDEEKYKEDVA